MLNYINKHKGLSIVVGLAIILFIILLIIFISLFIGGSDSKYGNRLDGIEEVELSNKFLKEIKTTLEEKENVVSANVRLQGKIVYILFEVNSDVSKDTAKEIANSTLEKFSEDELEFYDISYIVKWTITTDGVEEISAIEGTKHHLKDSISWSKA